MSLAQAILVPTSSNFPYKPLTTTTNTPQPDLSSTAKQPKPRHNINHKHGHTTEPPKLPPMRPAPELPKPGQKRQHQHGAPPQQTNYQIYCALADWLTRFNERMAHARARAVVRGLYRAERKRLAARLDWAKEFRAPEDVTPLLCVVRDRRDEARRRRIGKIRAAAAVDAGGDGGEGGNGAWVDAEGNVLAGWKRVKGWMIPLPRCGWLRRRFVRGLGTTATPSGKEGRAVEGGLRVPIVVLTDPEGAEWLLEDGMKYKDLDARKMEAEVRFAGFGSPLSGTDCSGPFLGG